MEHNTASANMATTSIVIVGKTSELLFNAKSSYVFSSSSSKQHPIFNALINDTSASNHMCYDLTFFKTLHSCTKPYQITLLTGYEITISNIGIRCPFCPKILL